MQHPCRGGCANHLPVWKGGWRNRLYNLFRGRLGHRLDEKRFVEEEAAVYTGVGTFQESRKQRPARLGEEAGAELPQGHVH
ncbi:MAG: hypothetical protein QOG67_2995 [Verrucomicrobiota bacterium]